MKNNRHRTVVGEEFWIHFDLINFDFGQATVLKSISHRNETWLCNKVETRKDFRFYYFWLYFVY